MDAVLKTIQSLIVRGDEIAAKAQLLEYLDVHPKSADGWWLVSLLANTDEDVELALKQCLAYDSAHYEAKRALAKLTQHIRTASRSPTTSEQAKSKTPVKLAQNKKAEPPQILNTAVAHYMKKGWEIKSFSPHQVTVQKTLGLAWGLAIILAVVIPVLGWILFFGNLFMRRRHEIKLNYLPLNQRVQVTGRSVPNVQVDWNTVRRGNMPMPQINYVGALVGGIILMLVLCGAFFGFIIAVGTDNAEFEVGDIAYIDHLGSCHNVYRTASYRSPHNTTYPNGYQVIIEEISEDVLGETWYRLSADSENIGWIPPDYLSHTQPRFIPSAGICR